MGPEACYCKAELGSERLRVLGTKSARSQLDGTLRSSTGFSKITKGVVGYRDGLKNGRFDERLIMKTISHPCSRAVQHRAHSQIAVRFPVRIGGAKQIFSEELVHNPIDGRFGLRILSCLAL